MRTRNALIALAVATAAIAACGEGAGGGATTPPGITTVPDATTTTSTRMTSTTLVEGDLPEDSNVVDAAIADLAERLSVPAESIEVLSARSVVWPDGALGCPEEGQMYTQATVEGSQVALRVDDRVFDYHAGSDGEVFLCPSDEKDGGHDFVPPPGIDE